LVSPGTLYDLGASLTTISDLYFKEDGSSFYILGTITGGAKVAQYNMSSAWNLSTRSLFNVSYTFTSGNNYDSLFFSPDGTRLYHTNSTLDRIEIRNLSTAWDITTLTGLFASMSHTSQQGLPTSIHIDSTGTKLFLLGHNANQNRINQFTLDTPWGTTMTDTQKQLSFNGLVYFLQPNVATGNPLFRGVYFSPTGDKIFLSGSDSRIYEFITPTPYGISELVSITNYSKLASDSLNINVPNHSVDKSFNYFLKFGFETDLATKTSEEYASLFSYEGGEYLFKMTNYGALKVNKIEDYNDGTGNPDEVLSIDGDGNLKWSYIDGGTF
jgi:hypothetical protein